MRMWKSSGIEAVATISVWLSAAGARLVSKREVVAEISSLFLLLFARLCVGTNVRKC